MFRSALVSSLWLLALSALPPGPASAEVTTLYLLRGTTTFASITPQSGSPLFDSDEARTEEEGAFEAAVASAVGAAPDRAAGFAHQSSDLAPGFLHARGGFAGSAEVTAASPFAEAFGMSRVLLRFEAGASTEYAVEGWIEAAGNGVALVSLVDAVTAAVVRSWSVRDDLLALDDAGTLPAGTYEFVVQTSGYGQAFGAENHPASGGFEVTLLAGAAASVAGGAGAETAASPAAAPNPARDGVRLSFAGGPVRGEPAPVVILDARGRLVRRLAPAGEGRDAIWWDTRDDRGAAAPAGVYYARRGTGPAARIVVAR